MADEFIGFQGTVNEVQWAKLMSGYGQKYTLVSGDPVRSTGRTVYIDPRVQVGCGVLYGHDAVKTVAVPTPATGQWHLLVARRAWASKSVTYVLVAGNVTADAEQAAPPASLPAARNKNVGITDDEPIAWIHARASTTTLKLWQMSIKRDGRVPGMWALYDTVEQGLTRVYSETDASDYVLSPTGWVKADGGGVTITHPAAGGITLNSGWNPVSNAYWAGVKYTRVTSSLARISGAMTNPTAVAALVPVGKVPVPPRHPEYIPAVIGATPSYAVILANGDIVFAAAVPANTQASFGGEYLI